MSVHGKVIVRKSRKGNVQLIAREHYLRDDLSTGVGPSDECPSFGVAKGRVNQSSNICLVPDELAVLRQIDVIQNVHPALNDILFLQSVLKNVRLKSAAIYNQVKQLLIESNDDKRCAIFSNENHRQTYIHRLQSGNVTDEEYDINVLQKTIHFLTDHWTEKNFSIRPCLLTDSNNLDKYKTLNIPVMTVKQLVNDHQDDLLELYAQLDEEEEDNEDDKMNVDLGEEKMAIDSGTNKESLTRVKNKKSIYPSYIPERKAKVGVRTGKYFQGTFHPTTYNVLEATVTTSLDSKDPSTRTQVLIVGRENQNRAIDGDVVIIEVLPKEEWQIPSNLVINQEDVDIESDDENNDESNDDEKKLQKENEKIKKKKKHSSSANPVPTGRIVAIGKRNWRPYCGTVSEKSYNGGDKALFKAIDRNIPPIRIRSRRVPQLLNKRVLVIVDQWERFNIHPTGHIIREIGNSDDKETETEIILIENGITSRKFSDESMSCLPDATWKVSEEHCKTRWDLRDWNICSVDPPGCTDIDDALHFREYSDSQVEIGVHIADVTAFISHDCALDKEAAERGCTVYLVDRRIEMLPSLLSSNMCSLRGNEERLAFSALIRLNKHDGSVEHVEFGRSVIKSKGAFTYEQAQKRIDEARKKMKKGETVDDGITNSLLGLADTAKVLREKRMKAGALILASPQVKFKISEARDEITDVSMYEIRETNKMVEEFMLLANIVVGERILKQFPQCTMLRRHPKPSNEMFEPLIKACRLAGYEDVLDTSNSKKLNESLNEISEIARSRKGDEYLGTLLRIIATRCMTQAVYFSSGEVSDPEYLHYGLAAPVYTHFTSPIRRYADVIVHRLLSACLGFHSLPARLQDSKHMNRIAEAINQRHRCAEYASRASTLLHTVLLFKRQGEGVKEEEARIIRIMGNGLVVLVPRYGVEGFVSMKGREEGVEVDEAGGWLKHNGRRYDVLGTVKVGIRIDTAPERMDRVIYELID